MQLAVVADGPFSNYSADELETVIIYPKNDTGRPMGNPVKIMLIEDRELAVIIGDECIHSEMLVTE
jgi:hypothetical protein